MPRKIDISQMTTEEIVAYAERVKQQTSDNIKKGITNSMNNLYYPKFLEKKNTIGILKYFEKKYFKKNYKNNKNV